MIPCASMVAHCFSNSSFWSWGVPVGPHRHRRSARHKVDPVVALARRQQAGRLVEDVAVVVQQQGQEIRLGCADAVKTAGGGCGRPGRVQVVPDDAPATALERQAQVVKVP